MKIINNKLGYTLIELLVASTIIILLTTVGVSSYVTANKGSRDAKRKADLEALRSSLEIYRSQNQGTYPSPGATAWTSTDNLSTLVTRSYIDSIPKDPQTTPYQYKVIRPAGTSYYGYCLGTKTEVAPTISVPTDCGTGVTGYNYYLKNP